MAKFGGGFPGGNMQSLMRQAQKMQQDMMEAQEKLKDSEVTGTVSGGMVEVTMNGSKQVLGIKIKPEIVDPEDVEMLEDMVMAALNDATSKVDELSAEIMGPFSQLSGGLF